MAKILIMVGKVTDKKSKLESLLKGFVGPETEIIMDVFSNLTFEVDEGNIEVKISGTDIKTFDLVFIRSVDPSLSFTVGILAYCLEKLHVKYFDKKFLNSRATSDKLTTLVLLGLNNLPIMPTFFCDKDAIAANADYLIEKFGYPIVAKELKTHHSQGLFIIRKKEDFANLEGRQFLFQKFTPLTEEYRFLVLGDNVRSVQKMYRDLSGSKGRLDLSHEYEFIDVAKMPADMKDLAVKCAHALNLQIAGVDLMIAKENSKVHVIEVNGNPGFTYETNISPEVSELAKFLEEEAKQ